MNRILIDNKTEEILSLDYVEDWLIRCVAPEYSIKRLMYVLVSDEELKEVNRTHLNHDYYTDIVSFDYSKGLKIKGECWISIDRIKENAKSLDIDFLTELNRVLCHGLLHFIGFNDKTEEQKKAMRLKENACLALLN